VSIGRPGAGWHLVVPAPPGLCTRCRSPLGAMAWAYDPWPFAVPRSPAFWCEPCHAAALRDPDRCDLGPSGESPVVVQCRGEVVAHVRAPDGTAYVQVRVPEQPAPPVVPFGECWLDGLPASAAQQLPVGTWVTLTVRAVGGHPAAHPR
jgi:hypothetical protein